MKVLILFLLIATTAMSQTREPEQHMFNLNGNPIILNSNNEYFKLDKFQLGWHWGSMKVLSRALLMNQADVSTTTASSYFEHGDFNDSTNYFVRAYYDTKINGERKDGNLYTHTFYDDHIVFTNGINYDPSIYIDPTDTSRLNIRAGDPQNPIFGFLNKRGRVPSNPADPNYSRLIIDSDIFKNQVILSEPWPNDQLTFRTKGVNGASDTTIDINFSGATFYLSINLRRIGINDTIDDAPVLKIEVPFVYRYPDKYTPAFGTAVFDSIPGTSYSMLPNGRGNVLNLDSAGKDGSAEMIITRRMLPLTSNDNGDITISGYIDFRNHNFGVLEGNKLLRESVSSLDSGKIDQLKLKVTYLGNCDVAIDWLRFETPNTRRLLRGEHDSLIIQGIQHALDTITKDGSVFKVAGNKSYRFIFNVEGGIRNWLIERYMSKLMGDIITGQNGLALIPQYDYYIGAADRWVSYIKIPSVLASPLTTSNWNHNSIDTIHQGSKSVYNLNLWKTLGLTQGYVKHPNNPTNPYFDIFNSGYETFLFSGESPLVMRDTTMGFYSDKYNVNWEGNPVSTMVYWETFMRRMMLNPMESGFVFSDKPWFAQSFLQSYTKYDEIHTDTVTYKGYYYNNSHSNTIINAELYRLMNWNPLILGAKGLMYDGDFDYSDQVKLVPNKLVLQDRIPGYDTSLTNLEFLNHPNIDPDFLDTNYNHISPTMGGLLSSVYKPDTVAKYMGTLPNRLYMGKRSIRMEMYKLHSWIRANENILMALRLQAWYGIGYKLWYKQHPSIAYSNIMRHYIVNDSIKTRKLFDVDSLGYKATEPGYESTYETFADITLLADTSDIEMEKSFIIGIQNRRTDPLIYFEENPLDKHILFLTTAELDDLCKNGGVDPLRPGGDVYTAEQWQNYYWKRFGCREITIPMALKKGVYNNGFYSITAKELGVGNYDSLGTWYSEPYYHRIDTIIPIDGAIVSKLLPGQGKMIECKRNSVFDNSEPSCNICDVINDFSLINFRVHNKYLSTPPNCCYEIILEKEPSCQFDSIPIKIITKGIETAEFNSLPMTDSTTNVKYHDLKLSTSMNGSYSLGNLCINSTEPATLEIVFGSNVDENFFGCDRKFSFDLDCESNIDSATNCCDKIDLSVSHYENTVECCTDIILNPTDSIRCVYGIDFNISGSDELNYIRKDTIPLVLGLTPDTLFAYCSPKASCIEPLTPQNFFKRKITFRGKDDEIICEDSVSIMFCCAVINPNGNFYEKASDTVNNQLNIPYFNIIPNPTDGILQLQINNLLDEVLDINIINQNSQVLKTFSNIKISNKSEKLSFDILDLAAGTYIVNISNNKINLSNKIIKLK